MIGQLLHTADMARADWAAAVMAGGTLGACLVAWVRACRNERKTGAR